MGKTIIGVHGLGNKPASDILSEWWQRGILEGLERINHTSEKFNFEMVYWADVFYEKPLNPTVEDHDDPLYLEEPYTQAPEGLIPEPHPVRQKILDMLEEQLDKIFLNDDLSINFSFITDSIIHAYFRELETYYARECPEDDDPKCLARDVIRNRVAETIRKYEGDDIMVVGHSMGSIIAYDVLMFTIPDVLIDTFITIGSPLGMPVVMAKIAAERNIKVPRLAPLKTPPGIQKSWLNFSDLEDRIALIYDLTDNYGANLNGVKVKNAIVDNDYVVEGKRNPHKSFGYLRTRQFAGAVHQFLNSTSQPALIRWVNGFDRFLSSIFYRNK